MVDVDGAVMPMFFLVLSIGYFGLKNKNFDFRKNNLLDLFFLATMVVGGIGGFFVKVSGILPIFAYFVDFLIEKGVFSDKRRLLKYILIGFLGVLFLILLLLGSKLVFPFFNLQYSLKYWEHFAVLDRGWMQIFIQFIKSLLYTSPLLLLPLFFIDKEIFKQTRPLFIFIFTGLFFYLFAFDFSLGALDRYFQFLIVPLSVVVGIVSAKNIKNISDVKWSYLFYSSLFILFVYIIQFLPHSVPSLYPKTEWLSRILSLKWNFLYPFFGGSGPLGFYVSFLFMSITWLFGFILVGISLLKLNIKKYLFSVILLLGVFYNGVFIQEYISGTINGSAPKLVKNATEFIKNNPEIKKVLVYNDNGGWDIRETGKYERRIYSVPEFESSYKKVFDNYNGYVFYLDIPRVKQGSLYDVYFNSCEMVYFKNDKYLNSKIIKCLSKNK